MIDLIKVELTFNPSEMKYLFTTITKSFLSRGRDRFYYSSGLEESKVYELDNENCFLFWCDSFLEAKILSSLYEYSAVFWDEGNEEWTVWSTENISDNGELK